MNEVDRLAEALDEFCSIDQLMIRTPLRTDDGWKREFIDLRRQLHAQIMRLSGLSEEIAGVLTDPALSAQYQDALSKIRHKWALHQANWPVVQIVSKDPGYRASVEEVRMASQNFVATAKRVISVLRGMSTLTKDKGS